MTGIGFRPASPHPAGPEPTPPPPRRDNRYNPRVFFLLACHDGPARPATVLHPDSAADSAADTSPGTDTGDSSAHPDTSPPLDTGDPFTAPSVATVTPIASSPTAVSTPPSWNPNLPKLASDGVYLYAVHTYYADDPATRYAAILSRPVAGGEWTEWARVEMPHQPPGLVVDAAGRLHLVFACQRPGSADVTCFPGGAGTQGQSRRFYHLVFETRDDDLRYRADTYGNWDEWTAGTNGYLGLGTTPDGTTWWSLADDAWRRVVQSWGAGGDVDTLATLDLSPYYLLYPVHASLSLRELLLFVGEFNPGGGSNAAYDAAVAFLGDGSEFRPAYQVAPGSGATLAAFPNDALLDAHGPTTLAYVDDGAADNLLATGVGTSAELETSLGNLGTYTKLHRDGDTLWWLAPSATTTWNLAYSHDSGQSWSSNPVAVEGLHPDDTTLVGFTLLRPDGSPIAHDPATIQFFAAGLDATGLSTQSYYGEVHLR